MAIKTREECLAGMDQAGGKTRAYVTTKKIEGKIEKAPF